VVVGGYASYQRLKESPQPAQVIESEKLFVIAVAPFWGQNADALEEGKVMQALVERRLVEELGEEKTVKILGKKEILEAPQSHDDAKAVGEELGATIVLWGEVLVLRGEVEIQPYVELVKWFHGAGEWSMQGMQTSLEGPNQLSLRKAKAEDVGQIALQVAGAFYRKKKPERALALLQRITPPTPESLVGQGLILLDRAAWSESMELFKRAADLDSNEPRAYWGTAGVYLGQRDYDGAVVWYRKAIEADSEFLPPYSGVGLCLAFQGKYDEATQWLERTIALFPGFFWAYLNMGTIDFRQERYDNAGVWVEKAIDVAGSAGELASAYTFMGAIHRHLGDNDEGQRWYEKAIESDPEASGPYMNIGNIFYEKQEYEEAIKWYQRGSRLSWGRVPIQYPASYMFLERYPEAVDTFRRLVEVHPGDRYNALLYIICLHLVGEREEAREQTTLQAETLDDDAWINAVIRFYAGEITEEDVLKEAEAEDPKTDNEQKCEAYYYLGMASLLGVHDGVQPDTTLARQYFEDCVSTGVEHFTEIKLARQMLESP
jgi:tetratricopeptide (TPR) repeat protein